MTVAERMAPAHVLVALSCEAKPLVRHYGLKRCMEINAFEIYANPGLTLTVSGVGKMSMAAAVAYTAAAMGRGRDDVWLNVGIAGHRNRAPGSCFVAHKITDAESGRSWYPPLVYPVPCETGQVRTVSRPELNCREPCLYDMEGSGFALAASRFSCPELIQCLKVVSDNCGKPASQVRAREVSEWIGEQLPLVEHLLSALKRLADELLQEPPVLLEAFLQRWHFTAQQRIQLENLLRRWELLAPDAPLSPDRMQATNSGRQVIAWIRQEVKGLPVQL